MASESPKAASESPMISSAKFKNQFIEFFGIMAMDPHNRVAVVDVETGKHSIPWKSPDDLAMYHKYIKHSVVIVGKKTYEVSPKAAFGDSPVVVLGQGANPTPADAIRCAVKIAKESEISKIAIVGGPRTYQTFWDMNIMKFMIVNKIKSDFVNDGLVRPGFAPVGAPQFVYNAFEDSKTCNVKEINNNSDEFTTFEITKINPTEFQFGEMLASMQNEASLDRTGHGRIFSNGRQITHDMNHGIPHEIMRGPAFKMISAELRAIMSGVTSAETMRKLGVPVWDANTTKEAQAKNARDTGYPDDPLAVDDIGASYGWNATKFGIKYPGADAIVANSGLLSEIAKDLKIASSEPRLAAAHQWMAMVRACCADVSNKTLNCRIRMSLWDPTQRCAITPCMEQFQAVIRWVDDRPFLDLIVGQRSSDSLLAGHWNLTYSYLMADMLARIVSQVTKTTVSLGVLTWNIGNAHYYGNQREAYAETLNAYNYHNIDNSAEHFSYSDKYRTDVYMRVVDYVLDPAIVDYVDKLSDDPVHRAILTYLSGGTYYTCGYRPKRLITSDLPMNA